MQIIDAKWTPQINMLVIKCTCGHQFAHRSDRWRVFCPRCRAQDGLGPLRDRVLAAGHTDDIIRRR